ncbi:hypothetical protein BSK57_23440 [Paenibacillus odorifer]|nr:hypothetical protein BSK57_23440 [Paenibacillus odorifer]
MSKNLSFQKLMISWQNMYQYPTKFATILNKGPKLYRRRMIKVISPKTLILFFKTEAVSKSFTYLHVYLI